MRASAGPSGQIRLLRMIGRLNVGGPAIQAITLSRQLAERGYKTTLVRGLEGPREGNMDGLAADLGVRPLTLRSLRRELGRHDLVALLRTMGIVLRRRPAILHTHAAKAGTVGRLASLLLGPLGPPVKVHTFHGHVLTGYFGSRSSRAFLTVERFLARHTTRLVAVSEEVRDELLYLGVAAPERIVVVPLGFDFARFSGPADAVARERARVRAELGLGARAPVVTLVARLVPIKRVDRFLRIARRVAANAAGARFLVVGDGELHDQLRSSDEARALGDRLIWAGLRSDMPAVYAASDVVVLTSDNEGTPVTLIEAQACGLPTVGTDVGGVRSVVLDGLTGRVVAPEDEIAFAAAVVELLTDFERRRTWGQRGQQHVTAAFSLSRLISEMDQLYRQLLAESHTSGAQPARPSAAGATFPPGRSGEI